jgi:membrane protease YdiL (CAAX protease family)
VKFNAIPKFSSEADAYFGIVLLVCCIAFMLYWFLSISSKIKATYFMGKNAEMVDYHFVVFTKIFGGFVMAILPLTAIYFCMYDVAMSLVVGEWHWKETMTWILAMGIPLMIASYFSGKNPNVQMKYPEVKLKFWDKERGLKYAFSWMVYLVGYEIMFRGVLFLIPAYYFGFWLALGLNLALYSISHVPKGADEAVVALPIGFLLCLATWQTEGIYAACVIHILMAWSGNYFAWFHQNKRGFV